MPCNLYYARIIFDNCMSDIVLFNSNYADGGLLFTMLLCTSTYMFHDNVLSSPWLFHGVLRNCLYHACLLNLDVLYYLSLFGPMLYINVNPPIMYMLLHTDSLLHITDALPITNSMPRPLLFGCGMSNTLFANNLFTNVLLHNSTLPNNSLHVYVLYCMPYSCMHDSYLSTATMLIDICILFLPTINYI